MLRTLLVSTLLNLCIYSASGQTLAWANSIGGYPNGGNLFSADLTVDNNGSPISVGTFYDSYDFDPGAGVTVLTSPAFTASMYIQKLDPAGGLLWARAVGSPLQFLSVANVATRGSAEIVVTGSFEGTVDFDPGSGVQNATAISRDLFVLKLDGQGNFLWVRTVGGSDWTYVSALATSTGYLVGGAFSGTVDFDPGPGVNAVTAVNADAFLLQLDVSGNFTWVRTFNSTGNAQIFAIRTAPVGGEIVIGGHFGGNTDFDPGTASFNLSSLNPTPPFYPVDCFVEKLDNQGNFIWARSFGGNNEEYVKDLVLTSTNDIVVNGTFNTTTDFDPSAATFNLTALFTDAYVLKLDASGNFVWAGAASGTSFSSVSDLAIDGDDNVYMTGDFQGTVDFDLGAGVNSFTADGADIYVLSVDPSGATTDIDVLVGPGFEAGITMAMDANSNLYSTGYFVDPMDFDPQATVFTLVPQNNFKWLYTFKWRRCTNATTNVINATGCTYTYNGQTYNGNGVYTQISQNVAGCDSITLINLTESSSNTLIDTASCTGSLTINGQTYTSSGAYVQLFTNIAGCDSNFYINATIGIANDSAITATACDFYTTNQGFYNASGIYTEVYTNSTGCDSVVTLDLTIDPSYNNTITLSGCDSLTYDGTTYYASTLQSFFNTGVNGCDSIITLDISITTTDTAVVLLSGGQLTAQALPPTTYQWVTCPGYAVIPGATNQAHIPTTGGGYAVILELNGCVDTSSCHTVIIAGVGETDDLSKVTLFPNPTSDLLHVVLPTSSSPFDLVLRSITGQVLLRQRTSGAQQLRLDMSPYASGIYFLNVENEDSSTIRKVVKK